MIGNTNAIIGESVDFTDTLALLDRLEDAVGEYVLEPQEEYFLTFSSPNSFTLSVNNNTKSWDGTLEYSTDKTSWNTWAGTSSISSVSDGVKHNIFVRGIGNTLITGSSASSSTCPWRLNGFNISISGNIENLLDYATVELGNTPAMASGAFKVLFAYPTGSPNGNIIDVSRLELPATTLTTDCYRGMFQANIAITVSPSLPASGLESHCYQNMFNACTSLITPPALRATVLLDFSYSGMFYGCTSLYVSDTQTAEAQYEWRIPANAPISGPIWTQNNMFYGCLGTRASNDFAGVTGLQYTYYTQNEPV